MLKLGKTWHRRTDSGHLKRYHTGNIYSPKSFVRRSVVIYDFHREPPDLSYMHPVLFRFLKMFIILYVRTIRRISPLYCTYRQSPACLSGTSALQMVSTNPAGVSFCIGTVHLSSAFAPSSCTVSSIPSTVGIVSKGILFSCKDANLSIENV